MGRPKGNGLAELHDEGSKLDGKSFFCMDFMDFARGMEWDDFHAAFQQAKAGNCPFTSTCKRYERTIKKRGHQLSIF